MAKSRVKILVLMACSSMPLWRKVTPTIFIFINHYLFCRIIEACIFRYPPNVSVAARDKVGRFGLSQSQAHDRLVRIFLARTSWSSHFHLSMSNFHVRVPLGKKMPQSGGMLMSNVISRINLWAELA